MRRRTPWYGEFLMTASAVLTVLVLCIYMLIVPCLGSGFGLALAGGEVLMLIVFEAGVLLTAAATLAGVYSENHGAAMQVLRGLGIAFNLGFAALVAHNWMYGEFIAAIELPLGITAAVNIIALVISLKDWTLPAHICEYCGYDLRGSDSRRCPECGELRFGRR